MQKLRLKPDRTASDSAGSYSPDLILTVPKKRIGAFDDVRASSLLDAMEASSPQPKSEKDMTNESSLSETDVIYRTWMVTTHRLFLLLTYQVGSPSLMTYISPCLVA